MKEGLELNKVVLLGRTFDEYARYFGLNENDLRGKTVLDVAGGVSSFCAEANAKGIHVTAFDPIYEMSVEDIQRRAEPDLDYVTEQIGKVKAYRWEFYKDPQGMRVYRERALRAFLPDYTKNRGTRYVAGKLPNTPFADKSFDVVLTSYFLFVYEDQFDYEFHKNSLRELLRVTRGEARLYPLVNFAAQRCGYVDRIKAEPEFSGFTFEEVKTDFEFLANSNWFLRIRRK